MLQSIVMIVELGSLSCMNVPFLEIKTQFMGLQLRESGFGRGAKSYRESDKQTSVVQNKRIS